MTALVICALIAATPNSALLISPSDAVGAASEIVFVDARPLDAYIAGHIPGARNVDVSRLSETRDGVAGLLRSPEVVQGILFAAGVDPAKRIVVYSGMKNADDFKTATRLFWILDYLGYESIALLDGGFQGWNSGGQAREAGRPKPNPIPRVSLAMRDDRLATLPEVKESVGKDGVVIADVREAGSFEGQEKAGVVAKAGHIPSATNLPSSGFLNETAGTVKAPEELAALVIQQGIDESEKAITYCNTGRSASAGYFILRLLGHDNVSLYDGSMAEWTQTEEVETSKPADAAPPSE